MSEKELCGGKTFKEVIEEVEFHISDKQRITKLEEENAELKEQIEKMKNCRNCKYLTRKLINCKNIQICKVNPNNIYGVCDIWELAE